MAETTKAAAATTAAKDYTKMNIWQKFAEVRKLMPTIQKQKHSDQVKYKFATIHDIYEFLSPAMSLVGLDWEIVSETTDVKDELGNPQYYRTFEQVTKMGTRLVWIYEADLLFIWRNVDNPQESATVKLHAVGDNDGGAAKAKGAAWTYCLKYYLFEKFNIDQADDDPDQKDLSGAEAVTNTAEKPKTAGGLSEAQIKRLYAIAAKQGFSAAAINRRIGTKYGKAAEQLTRSEYNEICDALEKAHEQQNGGEQK